MSVIQSSSEATTTTPTPISPFTSYSGGSEATSDELPDLGAFTDVFRALNDLQPQAPRALAIPTTDITPSSSILLSSSLDSDASVRSTVWSQRPIASYLSTASYDATETHESSSSPSDDDSGSGSHTEGGGEGREVDIEDLSDLDMMHDAPSLGYLDEALCFIAAERARVTAQREAEKVPLETESAWRHVVKPQRTRRRKKTKLVQLARRGEVEGETPNTPQDGAQDGDDSSSSYDQPTSPVTYFKSTPPTPPRRRAEKRGQRGSAINNPIRLRHSRSTPTLRLPLTMPPDPRILQLRTLAHKLRMLFPEDKEALAAVLSNDVPNATNFVDPRGPRPQSQDTLIHVFIDHSNILIGLLNYLKRKLPHTRNTLRRMLHAALALILERGRPITRRVLVTSSPLYQPMESAEQLGYEVRVYARVPDTGDGQDRRRSVDMSKGAWRPANPPFPKGHSRKLSGSTSTESEPGVTTGNSGILSQTFSRSHATSSRPSQHTSPSNPGMSSTPNGRSVRFREQGVDELLQLKLHQAIADVDDPPPNATIVLATGDGNVGQFNDDGFLGPVRTALKKGWKVELYAWEDGLSSAWMKEFGKGPYKDRFRIIGLEQFALDMVQILDLKDLSESK